MPPDLQLAATPDLTARLLDRLKAFALAFRQVCQGYMLPSPGC